MAWGRVRPEAGRAAGGHVRAHDVVICAGGQPALATAFRALAAPGEPVLVESPTYRGALAAVRAHLRQQWIGAESARDADPVQIPRPLWNTLVDLLDYAA